MTQDPEIRAAHRNSFYKALYAWLVNYREIARDAISDDEMMELIDAVVEEFKERLL